MKKRTRSLLGISALCGCFALSCLSGLRAKTTKAFNSPVYEFKNNTLYAYYNDYSTCYNYVYEDNDFVNSSIYGDIYTHSNLSTFLLGFNSYLSINFKYGLNTYNFSLPFDRLMYFNFDYNFSQNNKGVISYFYAYFNDNNSKLKITYYYAISNGTFINFNDDFTNWGFNEIPYSEIGLSVGSGLHNKGGLFYLLDFNVYDLFNDIPNNSSIIDSAYSQGYASGYEAGVTQQSTVATIFTGILSVGLLPINFFLSIFNFEILGINMASFVSALLSVCIVIIVIRTITGGKSKE